MESSEFWIDVPFVKQKENGCGAAVISMVFQYWNRENGSAASKNSDPDFIQSALYSEEGQGIYASDLQQYFEKHGFQVFAFGGDWSDLQHHLRKGRPLIVALAPNGKNGRLHYVVAVGIDPESEILMVNDPAERKLLKIKRSHLERLWQPTGKWTLLAVPGHAQH